MLSTSREKDGCSYFLHVTLIRMNKVNETHTVKRNGWTFKERLLEEDLQVFKGILLYHTRMSRKTNRSLTEIDAIDTITSKSTFDYYLYSEDYRVDLLGT